MDPTKYARLEDEQRFVVATLPAAASAPRRLEDRYLDGTRLRLRRVTDERGTHTKLGHKVRPDGSRPSAVWHTTCYLDDAEAALLATLPAAVLEKRRWSLEGGGCADEFAGPLHGLVLVEGDRPFACPRGGVEVTEDERFCGGALAALTATGAAALLDLARELLA